MDKEIKLYKENGESTTDYKEATYAVETREMTMEELKKEYPLYYY